MEAESVIVEAKKLLGHGKPSAAADVLIDLLDEEPDNHKALHLIGRTYLILEKPHEAAEFLRRSLEVQSGRREPLTQTEFTSRDFDYSVSTAGAEPDYEPGFETDGADSRVLGDENVVDPESHTAAETSATELQQIDEELLIDDEGWTEYVPVQTETVVVDWEKHLLEEDFSDPEEESIDYESVVYEGRLSPESRARQIASEYSLEYEIDEELFESLVRVLAHHKCHGQTKLAMRRLLDDQVCADELKLVFDFREYWRSEESFSRAYYGYSEPSLGYINLSWPLGLALVRFLRCEDVEEIVLFVEDCFDDWSNSPSLIESFNSFRGYLIHLMEYTQVEGHSYMPPFVDYSLFPDDETLPADFPGTKLYQWLEENNFLSREPIPWYPQLLKGAAIEGDADESSDEAQPQRRAHREMLKRIGGDTGEVRVGQ